MSSGTADVHRAAHADADLQKHTLRWTVHAVRGSNGYPDSRGLLAQWQSCGLLIHRFGVRVPGGPPMMSSAKRPPVRLGEAAIRCRVHLTDYGSRLEKATARPRERIP